MNEGRLLSTGLPTSMTMIGGSAFLRPGPADLRVIEPTVMERRGLRVLPDPTSRRCADSRSETDDRSSMTSTSRSVHFRTSAADLPPAKVWRSRSQVQEFDATRNSRLTLEEMRLIRVERTFVVAHWNQEVSSSHIETPVEPSCRGRAEAFVASLVAAILSARATGGEDSHGAFGPPGHTLHAACGYC